MCLPYTKCLRVMADVFISATAQSCDLVRNTVLGHVYTALFKFFICLLFLSRVFTAAWAFSSQCKQGLLSVMVCRLLVVVVSLVVEHGLP